MWFEDSDAEARVIRFLRRRHRELLLLLPFPHPHPRRDNHNDKKKDTEEGISFLDLGTGNGSLLFGLRDAAEDDEDDDDDGDASARPFANGRMLGVDYSARSVEFARRIARSRRQQARARQSDQDQTQTQTQNGNENRSRDIEEEAEEEKEEEEGGDVDVEFQLHDILHDPATRLLTGAQAGGWDVVLDKGTFDAVSLAPPSSTNPTTSLTADSGTGGGGGKREKERETETYPRRVLPLVREGGLLVVTSCNWTEDELRRWFEGSSCSCTEGQESEEEETPRYRYRFEQVARVEYPSFSFGGVKGQAISTLCFRKVRVSVR